MAAFSKKSKTFSLSLFLEVITELSHNCNSLNIYQIEVISEELFSKNAKDSTKLLNNRLNINI
jgi:hypothetical protein